MRYLTAALTITIGACTYVEPVDVAMHSAAYDFVEAVERGDLDAAETLLSREARAKIDYERFSETPGDLKPVVEAFREAAITTRNARSRDEPALHVANFGGRVGAVIAVMVREEGQWKVANLLEWADERSREP